MTFYAHMLTESVDIEPVSSLGSDGSPVYGAKTMGVDARIERGVEVGFGGDGSRDAVGTVVWLAQSIESDDRLHLPDGSVLEIQRVTKIPTTDGRTSIWRAEG